MGQKFKVQPAAGAQENPYLPPGPSTSTMVMEDFLGINTSTTRPGVDDKQCFWMDGWMPIGPRDARTLPDIGSTIYTAPVNTSLVFFDFGNIDYTPIAIAFLSDGSIQQINTFNNVVTQIAPPGTLSNVSRGSVGVSQWGNQYIIIVTQQPNGYFIWDGTNFYSPGSLAPGVTITDNGSGYSSPPTVATSGGTGSGATFVATVSGGLVTAVTITNPGSGFSAGDTVTLTFTGGGGSSAAATINLMPFGIGGNAVETYAGRVWVAYDPYIFWTAPGSVWDFSSADGGGNFQSSDSFLRIGYYALVQTNGFLYLIGDSSVNYISGVQTTSTGSPPVLVTTFTNQNADPEVGTPWPGTVDVWSRNIVFANAFGAHVSYGAAVTKISEPLDGVYNTLPNFGGLIPSAAKSIIYGKKVWILLLPIIDPITRQQVNKLFMWNGKIWWSSNQSVSLQYIQSQEINSVITAWGTEGQNLFPLFQVPSTNFVKTIQSRFWDTPVGYEFIKTVSRLWALFQRVGTSAVTVNISIDSEAVSDPQDYSIGTTVILTYNDVPEAIPVVNNAAVTIPVVSSLSGVVVLQPTAVGQQGALLGMTISTSAEDLTLISAKTAIEPYEYRG